jgi:hypothetical protein
MGEGKRKQSHRQKLLLEHPWCIYCGRAATTTDHFPPRCFFVDRQWPETYEFACCSDCNQEGRAYEQAFAVLARVRLRGSDKDPAQSEWGKLLRGLRNNQPDLVNEWFSLSRNEVRKSLREAYGPRGDEMRRAGWGSIHLGPITQRIASQFLVKLSKALYYLHNGSIFDGILVIRHVDLVGQADAQDTLTSILNIAPLEAAPTRGKLSLADQFHYRFNHNAEHGAMYAVVQFNEQLIFQVIALRHDMAARLEANLKDAGMDIPSEARFECRLKNPPGDIV